MSDDTEEFRRRLIRDGTVDMRAALASALEKDLTTDQLKEKYEVLGFSAPFVAVRRKSDGVIGTFMFKHSPRTYFDWKEDEP